MGEGQLIQVHRRRPMIGRDPSEEHRVASPLELLYDLTVVVAPSLTGSQFAAALVDREIIARRQERGMTYALAHMVMYGAIAAAGAGLHASASFVESHTMLDEPATVLTMAVPVAVFVATLMTLYHQVLPGRDPAHVRMVVAALVVLAGAWALALANVSIAWCVVVVTLSPWILVVEYEAGGHRRMQRRLGQLVDADELA